mgnify:CR=1 FL=1
MKLSSHVKHESVAQLQPQGFGNAFLDAQSVCLLADPISGHHLVMPGQFGGVRQVELTVHEALRTLARLGVSTRLVCSGFVVRQDPEPGTAIDRTLPARLWLERLPQAPESQEALARAYHAASSMRHSHTPGELGLDLDCCRLYLAVRMLGWSDQWTPPAQHTHNWLTEAATLAERLERRLGEDVARHVDGLDPLTTVAEIVSLTVLPWASSASLVIANDHASAQGERITVELPIN